MNATRLVYAQQDINSHTNNLIVLNNNEYIDSGINIGPDGTFNNLRISYNTQAATGKITGDSLSIETTRLAIKNIPDGKLTQKAYKYLLLDDVTGELKIGYTHYPGDLNTNINNLTTNINNVNNELNNLKNDINNLKNNPGCPINCNNNSGWSLWNLLSFIIPIILVIIIMFYLWSNIHQLNNKINSLNNTINLNKTILLDKIKKIFLNKF
jgi:cell division protein FtsL